MNKLLVTYVIVSTALLIIMWSMLQAGAAVPFASAFALHCVVSILTVAKWRRGNTQ